MQANQFLNIDPDNTLDIDTLNHAIATYAADFLYDTAADCEVEISEAARLMRDEKGEVMLGFRVLLGRKPEQPEIAAFWQHVDDLVSENE